jgi:hypothetical protein
MPALDDLRARSEGRFRLNSLTVLGAELVGRFYEAVS